MLATYTTLANAIFTKFWFCSFSEWISGKIVTYKMNFWRHRFGMLKSVAYKIVCIKITWLILASPKLILFCDQKPTLININSAKYTKSFLLKSKYEWSHMVIFISQLQITSCPDCPVFLEACCSCPLVTAESWY